LETVSNIFGERALLQDRSGTCKTDICRRFWAWLQAK